MKVTYEKSAPEKVKNIFGGRYGEDKRRLSRMENGKGILYEEITQLESDQIQASYYGGAGEGIRELLSNRGLKITTKTGESFGKKWLWIGLKEIQRNFEARI